MQVGDLVQFVERPGHVDPMKRTTMGSHHGQTAVLIKDLGYSTYDAFGAIWLVLLENGSIMELYSYWMEVVNESR